MSLNRQLSELTNEVMALENKMDQIIMCAGFLKRAIKDNNDEETIIYNNPKHHAHCLVNQLLDACQS